MKYAGAVLYMGLAGEGAARRRAGFCTACRRPAAGWRKRGPCAFPTPRAWRHFPMGPRSVSYNESIYIGYRYYDKAGAGVAFPFGYGLSYTSFAYSGLQLSTENLARHEALALSFRVRNTGARVGRETAQVYFSHTDPSAHQPVRTLGGLCRGRTGPR